MPPIYVYIALAVLAVGIVYWFFLRKPAEETRDEPKALGKGKPVNDAAKPGAKKVEAEAAVAKKSERPADKPARHAESERPKAAAAKADEKEPAEDEVEVAHEEPLAERPAAPGKASLRPSKQPGAAAAPRRAADVAGLRKGLTKARDKEGIFGRLRAIFGGKKEIDPGIVEQIEEVLLTSDVGVKTTELLVGSIKEALAKHELNDENRVWDALREEATEILDIGGGALVLDAKPTVVMVVGVNGVGKTTTIGKLATRLTQQGKKVVLAAGDTFRAAAVQQLTVWGKRVDCEVVSGAEGANPGAVIFDAIQKAKEIRADVVLADTAGRLHTKSNLMEELKKIHRTMNKALEGAPHETLLVVDATNGQNATQQAALFKEALPLSGIVLTKLDGTAKGGIVLSIAAEHQIPVRYIGIGERAEDLRDFVAEEFVEALLGRDEERGEAAA